MDASQMQIWRWVPYRYTHGCRYLYRQYRYRYRYYRYGYITGADMEMDTLQI